MPYSIGQIGLIQRSNISFKKLKLLRFVTNCSKLRSNRQTNPEFTCVLHGEGSNGSI